MWDFPLRSKGLLDVHFINTLPVPAASRHSRESGNPGDERHGGWMPAGAGMTFYWCRTYETDIEYSTLPGSAPHLGLYARRR